MKRFLLFFIIFLSYYAQSQVLNVNNVWVTGHFNGCNGNNTPSVSLSFVSGSGSVFSNGGIQCIDPCGTTTIKVTINGIKWKKDPGDQWLHGIFLPANSGYTVSGINLPAGFSTYPGGCTGGCSAGILTGPGFYYDATGNNSCCGFVGANDGTPCNNWGQSAIDCPGSFGLEFNLTFCNSSILSTTDTFTLRGTGDGLTGCWSGTNGLTDVNTINFTVSTTACGPINNIPVSAAPVVKDCSGATINYTSTLTGGCGNGNTVTWWTAPVGGTQVGSGSPFIYDPAGAACPAGTTLYASCCPGGITTCIARTSVTIPGTCDPALQITATSSFSGDCINPSEISSVSVINNSGPVTYTLNPGGVSNSTGVFTGLTLSSYTVVASDGSTCTASTVVNFIPIQVPLLTVSSTPILCFGDTTSIWASGSGTIAPYNFGLNGGALQANGMFPGLSAGTYTMTLSDGNGCTVTSAYTLTQPNNISITGIHPPILCFGDSTTLTINASGGTPNYQYSLNGGAWQVSSIFNFITAGSYTVAVMDANNCTATTVLNITQPVLLSATVANTPILCYGGGSTVTITASGGTLPSYQYNLSGAGFQTWNVYTGVSAGTYTVQVYDGNNCTYTTTITITQPPAITLSSTTTPILCNGGSSTLTITAAGGTPPIEYSLNGGAYQSLNVYNGLAAGSYTISVKDGNGCTKTQIKVITQPPVLNLSAMNDTVNCFGDAGTLTALASGGVTAYQFSLNGGANQSNATFNNLLAGIYTLTVTDANGCTATTLAEVVEPPQLFLSVSFAPIACNNGTTDIVLTATGGNTLSYQYSLNGGAYQTSNTFNAQPAGTYTCTAQDASGCAQSTVIQITEPPLLSVQALSSFITCYGGTAIVSAIGTGGTGTLQYSLNGGAYQNSTNFPGQTSGTYTITVMDANFCTASSTVIVNQATQLVVTASSSSIACSGALSTITVNASGGTVPLYQYSLNGGANQLSNLFPGNPFGTYTVQVTDGNNCTATTVLTIVQPQPLSVTLNASAIACFGGTTTIISNVSGGTANYQYSLNGGALQTANTFNAIGVGSYTVMVTDANNCTATSTINLTQPNLLTLSASAGTILCHGGTTNITATANGGTLPSYSYSINGGALQSSNVFNSVLAGTYTIEVVDGNNCTATTVVNITQPNALQVSASAPAILCNGNLTSIVATEIGGTPLYQYQLNGGAWQSNTLFTSVAAGNYTVVVLDGNNCTASTVIAITQPPVLTITLSASPILCFGGTTSIVCTANGGTLPAYSYSLNGGTNQSANTFPLLTAGLYTVTVFDGNNCTATSTLIITEPPLLTLTASAGGIACYGGNTNLTATAAGGSGSNQYNINGGAWQSNNLFSNLVAGSYTVTVKDINNCTASTIVLITQPTLLGLTASAPAINCYGASTTISANASGGTSPTYQYNLNGGAWQTSNQFTNVVAGVYTLTVQDANGCTATTNITLTQPAQLIINSISSTTPTCIPGNDAVITVLASGGTPNLSYNINGGAFQSSNVFIGLGVSTYTIIVQDANNCTVSSTQTVTNPNSPVINAIGLVNVTCPGGSNGSASVIAAGNSTLTYTLQPGNLVNTLGIFTNLSANTYTVSVADANQCSASSIFIITQPTPFIWNTATAQPTSCYNTIDGAITVNVSGGTGQINYTLLPVNSSNITGLFNNLTGGIYTIIASDANLCTTSTILQIIIPTPITLTSFAFTNETCNNQSDGTISIACNGGSGLLTYTINPGANANTTGLFTGLSAALYTITVTDVNNCSYQTQQQITTPPPMIFSFITHTDVQCVGNMDGSIMAIASGGNGGTYTYTVQPGNLINTTGLFTNLGVNTYVITASDANGCAVTATEVIITPSPLIFTADSLHNVSCFGGNDGAIFTSASGGTAPYTYTLMPPGNIDTIGDYTALSFGTYSVQVIDANGCSLTLGPIVINQPPSLNLVITNQQNIACNGGVDGSVTVAASGGTGNLVLSIQPSIGGFISPGTFTNLPANTYTITVTDDNACLKTILVNITQNPPVQFDSVVLTPPTCFGDINGVIAIFGSGGSGNLTYELNHFSSSTSGYYTGLIEGTYTVTVLDDQGCFKDSVVQLVQPYPLSITSLIVTPTDCDENINGKIEAQASGGTPDYTYILRPQIQINSTGTFIHLSADNYTLTVKDKNGCELDTLATIFPPEKYMEISINTKDMGCFGHGVEGEATANVINGTPPYTYAWNSVPPQFTQTATDLKFGYYFVEITDARGCIRKDTVFIKPGTCCEEIFIPNAFSPNGDGLNDEFKMTTSTGLEVIDFAVYNRWGVKVWHTYDLYRSWDGSYQGKDQDMGTYYYFFKYKCLYDGNTYIKKGDVILVR